MARFIDAGPMTFDALVYGRPHPATMDFLARQFETPTQRLTQAGQSFMAGAAEMYERISSSRAVEAMMQAARAVNAVWTGDVIRNLHTLADFQFAPLSMQRFIMAEPTIREMYLEQTIEGFSDSYVDMYPGDIGDRHYDYRRAVNGYMMENESDAPNEPEWSSTTYLDELVEGDRELSLSEQVDIEFSWRSLRQHLGRREEDPTSRYGSRMV